MARTTSNSDGYVTLAVLLVVGLLAVIASSILAVSRPALGLARLGGDEVAAAALLEGGFTTAGFMLLGAKEDPKKVNRLVLRMDTGDIRLDVSDEAARVDLNAADPGLLSGLFKAVGGELISAQAFGNRVVDWRDEDSDLNEKGAEAGEYSEAGLDYSPPNMPFHSVEEARFILGLSAKDFALLKPYLTVFSGTGKVDPLSAPEMVIRAIPGANRREVQQLLRTRGKALSRTRLVEALPGLAEHLLDEASGVYRVRVDVELKNGFRDAAETVITGMQQEGGSADYRTVAWSKLAADTRSE